MENRLFYKNYSGFDIYFYLFYEGVQSVYVAINPLNHIEVQSKSNSGIIGEILKVEDRNNYYPFKTKFDPSMYE